MADQTTNPNQTPKRENPPNTADIAGANRSSYPTGTQGLMGQTAASGRTASGASQTPLLNPQDGTSFRTRWTEIQGTFVDDPRHSVEQADQLVAELMQNLAQTFNQEKNKLESEWERGQDVSTEDLRMALQRYRSFFDRLLTV